MAHFQVDKSNYVASHHGEPDLNSQALWTFAIEERKMNFWGRYAQAVSTAERYAQQCGMQHGTLRLLDSSGAWKGQTTH